MTSLNKFSTFDFFFISILPYCKAHGVEIRHWNNPPHSIPVSCPQDDFPLEVQGPLALEMWSCGDVEAWR